MLGFKCFFFFNLTAKYKCSVVHGCYVRERNSTYIHTFQHKNIQPFTREKRLGGVHSHKHFSNPMGTFWKESTVLTSLLLERAEIAWQMGDSGDSWQHKVIIALNLVSLCLASTALPCSSTPSMGTSTFGSAQQSGRGNRAVEITCVEFIIQTLPAQPVRPADKSTHRWLLLSLLYSPPI